VVTCAPVALFVYNRPDHTRRTVEALKQNILSEESDLIVFSDAPRSEAQAEKVREVRDYLRTVSGFKSVSIVERTENLGLAESIIAGVSEVVNEYGKLIVMEDDLVTSPFFLRYMNDALEYYENEDRVISIHGYCYPISGLPETFFLKGADCWSWGTWKRGWDLFEADGRKLLEQLEQKGLLNRFDFFGTYGYSQMLRDQIEGKNSSWAVRWYASALLKDKLTLYPGQSLVFQIGTDGSGTNCGVESFMDVVLCDRPVIVGAANVSENLLALEQFQHFFSKLKPSWSARIKRRTGQILKYFCNFNSKK